MIQFSLLKTIFFVIPEQMLMIYVGIGLIGARVNFNDSLKIAMGGSVVVWIFRSVLGNYGIHTIMTILYLVIAVKIFKELNWLDSLIAILMSYILIFFSEYLLFFVWRLFFEQNITDFVNSNLSNFFLLSYLSKFLLIILALLIHYQDFKLINLAGDKIEERN